MTFSAASVARNSSLPSKPPQVAAGTRGATIFTPAPNVVPGPERRAEPYLPPSDFPPAAAFQHEALTSATALIDVVLDSERVEASARSRLGRAQPATQRLAREDGENRASQQRRKSIDVRLLSDLGTAIAEETRAADVAPGQLRHWILNEAAEDIRELPATALFCEMLHDRHLNKGTVWKPNDLTDIIHLAQATGYADIVVCERHIGKMLTQGVRRLGRPTRAIRRLRDAIPDIEAAPAETVGSPRHPVERSAARDVVHRRLGASRWARGRARPCQVRLRRAVLPTETDGDRPTQHGGDRAVAPGPCPSTLATGANYASCMESHTSSDPCLCAV